MKLEDLRIGHLVTLVENSDLLYCPECNDENKFIDPPNNKYHNVCDFKDFGKGQLVQIIKNPASYIGAENIIGVELSTDVLDKLGFKENPQINPQYAGPQKTRRIYEAVIDNNHIQLYVDGSDFNLCQPPSRSLVKVRYVHDIQNLFKSGNGVLRIDYCNLD